MVGDQHHEAFLFDTITLVKLGQPLDPTRLRALRFFIVSVHLDTQDAFAAPREAFSGSFTRRYSAFTSVFNDR